MASRAEKFARELAVSRELHKTDVAFIKANPIHTPEVGAQKAKEFIAHLSALTKHIEADFNGTAIAEPIPWDAPAHYEVEAFFTAEQRAEVAALHARMEQVDLRSKAQSYDELVETLAQIGLCPDDLDGKPIIAVHDLQLATEWLKSAYVIQAAIR